MVPVFDENGNPQLKTDGHQERISVGKNFLYQIASINDLVKYINICH